MVRSNQQLIERMTLIWHSWFATSEEASNARLMINQNWTMRRNALGNFHELLLDVTVDPAMLLWLNGNTNNKYSPNENYGREMLELFTLGQGRGYNQDDVHQNARALTGWTNDWSETAGRSTSASSPTLHDYGVKKIFGHVGRWNWRDSVRFAVAHPTHPSFFVEQAVGVLRRRRASRRAPPASSSGLRPRRLRDPSDRRGDPSPPAVLRGAAAGTPPIVWTAGLLRASRQTITTTDWAWIAGTDRAGAVPAAERRPAGTTRSGSTPRAGPAGCRPSTRRWQQARRAARPTRTGSTRTPRRPTTTRSRSGAASRCPSSRASTCSSSAAGSRTARPRLGAGRVPAAAPERAAQPDPDDPRLDDGMSDCRTATPGQPLRRLCPIAGDPARARQRSAAGGARVGFAHADPGRRRASTAAGS